MRLVSKIDWCLARLNVTFDLCDPGTRQIWIDSAYDENL